MHKHRFFILVTNLSLPFVLFSACVTSPPISLLPVTDLPHDLRPSQRGDANIQPDRDDAAAVPLGRLSAVPCSHAAGLPI